MCYCKDEFIISKSFGIFFRQGYQNFKLNPEHLKKENVHLKCFFTLSKTRTCDAIYVLVDNKYKYIGPKDAW